MPLQSIRAVFECDGCGRPFILDVDPAYKPPVEWSIFDVIVDTVRGGIGYRGFVGEKRSGFSHETGLTSVQGDLCLCPNCTRAVDNFVPEDRGATADEVRAALSQET